MEREIAQRFAALPPESQRQFLQKLQQSGLNFSELPIVTANRQSALPLSYAQRGLWLTWQIDPENPSYNMPGMLRVTGTIDVAAVQASINILVQRHEVLRTIFVADENLNVTQTILPACQIDLVTLDLRACKPADVDLQRHLQGFFEKPFRLDSEPPMRVALFEIADAKSMLCFSLHHIACDGWSVGIFIEEFFALYAAPQAGTTPQLADLPIQYADYAIWQRNWFDAGERDNQINYWRGKLGQEHPVLNLPTDKQRTSATDLSAGAEHVFHLPAALSDQLRALLRAHDSSLYMGMVSLLALMLHRFSGETDIRIGSPVANRSRTETHGLIGYFTNLQVLRIEIVAGKSFADLLRDVRQTVLEAQSHQEMPFDLLVETLQPERQPGVHPLFQVKCTQQSVTPSQWTIAGLSIQAEEYAGGHAHFDFSCDFIDAPDGIQCIFAYAAELYDAPVIERLARAFVEIADQIVAKPALAPRQLVLPEPLSLLRGNAVAWEISDVVSLWDCAVENHARDNAVRSEEGVLTYAELDRRADQLAQTLIAQGMGPDRYVGIYASRSREFVLAVLAILKAGAAYVPLDPQLPADRLCWQLQDCGAELLLAAEPVTWPVAIPVLALDLTSALQRVEHRVEIDVCAAQAAYLIYTSGSTGKPKGVVVSRGALANYVQAMLKQLALPREARNVAMISTVAADLGHTSFFGALCSGRCLHLISQQRAFDPDQFAQYMHQHRVDVLKIVPSHLQALLQAKAPADVLPECALIVGGETTHWPLLETISALKPSCRVFNHYGPTETTVGALMQPAQSASNNAPALALGWPLDNVFAAVLDGDLNAVPHGVAGELYLGGAGLARGYRGRSAQTAERFVANPFANGERLYRTGDKVRQLQDGSLLFLGRMDDQVKIRGYRVEPGEVRTAILAEVDIRDAAVIAVQADDGRAQLHAFVVPEISSSVIDIDALRAALSQALPDYMMPAYIAARAELPLTVNGKLDRKALLIDRQQNSVQSIEPPQGLYEELLAQIWKEILTLDRIGRTDNFFDLGGDSVLGLKLIARIRRKMPGGDQFSLPDLMQTKTLAELAARLQNKLEHIHDAVCLNAGGTGMPFFCLPGLIVNTREFMSLAQALSADRPVYSFVSHVYTRNRWRGFSINALAAEYADFIKATTPMRRCALLGWSSGGDLAIEVARLLEGNVDVDFLGMLDVFETEPLRANAPQSAEQLRAAEAAFDQWVENSCMASHWRELLARMNDEERQFVAEQMLSGDLLPTDGDADDAHEYLLWTTMDKRVQALRYEYPHLTVPVHVIHAEQSIGSDGVLRDWSVHAPIASTAVIPQCGHLDIIHHPQLHSRIRDLLCEADARVAEK